MTMSIVEIKNTLKQLRLSGACATLETRLVEAQSSNLAPVEVISALLLDECDRRQSCLIDKCFTRSGLPERASLVDFDWAYNPEIPKRTCFELNTLKFIAEGLNGIFRPQRYREKSCGQGDRVLGGARRHACRVRRGR